MSPPSILQEDPRYTRYTYSIYIYITYIYFVYIYIYNINNWSVGCTSLGARQPQAEDGEELQLTKTNSAFCHDHASGPTSDSEATDKSSEFIRLDCLLRSGNIASMGWFENRVRSSNGYSNRIMTNSQWIWGGAPFSDNRYDQICCYVFTFSCLGILEPPTSCVEGTVVQCFVRWPHPGIQIRH